MLQSNLIYSKSYGPEVLFRSIENSIYREVDIKIYTPPPPPKKKKKKNDEYQFSPIKHVFGCVKETSQ